MIALVGAMFVAMGSASAAALGDCVATDGTTNYLVVGDTCTITEEIEDGDTFTVSAGGIVTLSDDGTGRTTESSMEGNVYTLGTGGSVEALTVSATSPGRVTITDSADTAATYTIEVLDSVQYAIEFDDSDGTVKAGQSVKVRISAKGAFDNDASTATNLQVRLDVPSTGLYFTSGTTDGSAAIAAGSTSQRVRIPNMDVNAITAGAGPVFTTTNLPTLSTAGAPDGEYTVTATVLATAERLKMNTVVTATLVVGDAGAAIGSATLSLDTGQKSTVKNNGEVKLVVTSKNSLDENSNAGEVNSVTLFAPFGDITHGTYGNIDGITTPAKNSVQLSENDVALDDVGAVTKFTVKSQNAGSRTIDVYAIVIGKDGSATTETLTLTFSGAPDALDLGEASATLLNQAVSNADSTTTPPTKDTDHRDVVSFSLSATDKAGNAIGTPDVTTTVTGPDDKDATAKFTISQDDANPDDTIDNDKAKITVASKGTVTAPVPSGEYTLKVKSRTNTKLTDESTFTVVGLTDNVSIEASAADEDGQIDVTVMVSADEEGTPVADGTAVSIEAADLRGDGDKVLFLTSSDGKTKAGVAKATLIEIGPGRAAIIATADGKTDVERVTSTYGAEDEAMPEEEAGLSCLSSLSGFSTWTCDVEASASEIFDWISSRGATALHLNSNRMWVRYSVVDGAMVPGSSDFMVTKSDILYISN